MPPTTDLLHRPDGSKVAFEVSGSAGDPAVVLVHGFGLTLRMWDPTIPDLVEAGWRVVTLDLRGHGLTNVAGNPGRFTLDAVVDDILALADHLEVDQFVLGGLSLGGFVTLATWVRAPSRLRALVLADSGPGFRNEDARKAWNATATDIAERIEADGSTAVADLGMTGRSDPAALGLDRHRSPRDLGAAARGFLAQFDSRGMDALATITAPTIVLVGEDDTAFLAAARTMTAKIPNAQSVVIANAGHVSNVDNPEEFNRHLIGFLRKL